MNAQPISSRLPSTFWWHNATQFGGALNDNLFKLLMIYALIDWSGLESSASILAKVGIAFALPFLVFLPIAGGIADYFAKHRIIRILKATEFGVMLFGTVAFFLQSSMMLYGTMFLMATQSALFGPCKYGILPEQVGAERLSKANGSIQLFTFLAIILGTVIAPELSLLLDHNYGLAACVSLLIASLGFLASLKIEPTPNHQKGHRLNLNGFSTILQSLRFIRKDGYLVLTVCAIALFGLIGAFVQMNVLDYGAGHLNLKPEEATRLFLIAALGIGIGASLSGWISGRSIEFGIVPLGAGLMAFGMAWLGLAPENAVIQSAISILILGLGAGLFIVPLESFIQFRSPSDQLGSIQATGSFLSWLGILLASGLLFLFASVLNVSPQDGFLILSIALLILTVFSLWILPDFFAKFVTMVITRTCYRLKIRGLVNVPTSGGALMVSNHVSLMDALLIAACLQRRPRMLMSRDFYENSNWLTRTLCDLGRVILIHSADNPKLLIKSLKTAREALDEGYLVCIFAEGSLSRTGMMRPFKPGFERIVKGTNYPIIPIYIGGAWGSLASYRSGMPKIRPISEFRYPVSVTFGTHLPASSSTFEVQQAVSELSVDSFNAKRADRKSLGYEWIKSARRNWKHTAMTDSSEKSLSYGESLIASLLLRDTFKSLIACEETHIGILLPTGHGAMLTNLALTLSQRVGINLNHTTPPESFASALNLADLKTVVTSRKFLDAISELPLPENTIYLEDLITAPSTTEKLKYWIQARTFPTQLLLAEKNYNPDDVATVLFSSGSTAEPKGVMLSHHNLLSNIEAFRSVLSPEREDVLLATLPLFHSFGYTANFWFPLLSGLTAACHTNPLEAETIGKLSGRTKATILLTTPSFLIAYCRKIKPEQFASLRYVFTGAEKLQDRIGDMFTKRFGVRPLEGYGATELSPVCALSLPNVEIDNLEEQGNRKERLGRVLPGMAIRILHPDTAEILPSGQEGLINVKGPNVMKGYLKREALTKDVIKDGWYNTGDLGIMDADGFFAITGRLSRFSKIGGEMVSHGAVEQALQSALKLEPNELAVVSIADPKKGERLCVVHTPLAQSSEDIASIVSNLPIANLWKPKANDWHEVDNLPLLGSGKLNFRALKEIVETQ